MTSSLLEAIVAASRHAAEDRERRVPLDRLPAGPVREPGVFRRALHAGEGTTAIIAECKRRSPARGILRADYDPAAIAASYASRGAAAISVLTEPTFFDGDLDHLRAVRVAVDLPVLRKDFIVTPYQIAEARAAGADAVLLIVAALDDSTLRSLLAIAEAHMLDALVEAHDERELDRALSAGARIVGVNSRDLHTLTVDADVFARLAPRLPAGVTTVAESGLRSGRDIAARGREGYRACLIGERLMAADDPGAALGAMVHESREAAA